MRLKDFAFIGNGPPVYSSLARTERTGDRIELLENSPISKSFSRWSLN